MYIRFVVVKKLVVETRSKLFGELNGVGWHQPAMVGVGGVFCSFTVALLTKHRHCRKAVFLFLFTLKKLGKALFVLCANLLLVSNFILFLYRVFKTRSILKRFEATRVVDSYTFNLLNSSAWDNETRPFLFLILLVLQ